MITSQPVWAVDGSIAASTQGFLGVNTIKLGGIPVVAKNDTRRLIGKYYVVIIVISEGPMNYIRSILCSSTKARNCCIAKC